MGKALSPSQTDKIREWVRLGFTPQEIEKMAKNNGFSISAGHVYKKFIPEMQNAMRDDLAKKSVRAEWFDKEFRAEKAAEMAELLYQRIMNGEMFAEEVTEKEVLGGTQRTSKPMYFAGMIKNWKDLVDLIGTETGQRRKTVDLNYNKNQNLNISFLIDKIFENDEQVDKQIEDAEIIDLPSETDFADDAEFEDIVEEQTDDEMKALIEPEDMDGYSL